MLKYVNDRPKCVQKLIFKILKRNRLIHKELGSWGIIVRTVCSLPSGGVDNEILRALFKCRSRSGIDKDAIPKTFRLVTSVHTRILWSSKCVKSDWANILRSKYGRLVLMYYTRCYCVPRIFLIHVELEQVLDAITTVLSRGRRISLSSYRVNELNLPSVKDRTFIRKLVPCVEGRVNLGGQW